MGRRMSPKGLFTIVCIACTLALELRIQQIRPHKRSHVGRPWTRCRVHQTVSRIRVSYSLEVVYVVNSDHIRYPNVWPKDMPELKEAFTDLGGLIVSTGKLLAKHCDKYLSSTYPDLPPRFIQGALEASTTCKARLLHYFPAPSNATNATTDLDSWCGLHIDHSLLTGLTSALYVYDTRLPEICPLEPSDPTTKDLIADGGLYIKSRHGELFKVEIPPNCLAFQIGEASQLASRGLLVATPHLVKSSPSPNVSRNTFAVFLQPNVDHVLVPESGLTFDAFTKEVMKRHY